MFVDCYGYSPFVFDSAKHFKRILNRDEGWLSTCMIEKMLNIVHELESKFGDNKSGRGHWNEIEVIREQCVKYFDTRMLNMKKNKVTHTAFQKG